MLTCIGGATSVELFNESSAWMASEERERPPFVDAAASSLPETAGLLLKPLSLEGMIDECYERKGKEIGRCE